MAQLLFFLRRTGTAPDDSDGGDCVTVTANIVQPKVVGTVRQHAAVSGIHVRGQDPKLPGELVQKQVAKKWRILMAAGTGLKHGGGEL